MNRNASPTGWRARLPAVRGRLAFDEPLASFTWLRVGGPADVLFLPADEDDLARFLSLLPAEISVTVLGVGSNLIIRDGGTEGVVVRLAGRGFASIRVDAPAGHVTVGAGALDGALARAVATAGMSGLEFFAGIPGSIGGALAMNAGCYGSETAATLVKAWGVDREGRRREFAVADFGFGYRSSQAPADIIWTAACFAIRPAAPETIAEAMARITHSRELSQPIREKTGGSTFKNPPGRSAWRLLDEAGWRGRGRGAASFSSLHANFLINTGAATASDLEALGEAARADVLAKSGVQLDWEIKRVGRP